MTRHIAKNTPRRRSHGAPVECNNSRKNTCSNQLSITTPLTPIRGAIFTEDGEERRARLTLPTECHLNCTFGDAKKEEKKRKKPIVWAPRKRASPRRSSRQPLGENTPSSLTPVCN